MRSQLPISIPLSLVVTFCVWFAFLWTMQHAPGRRPVVSGDGGMARSSGGLANNFATKVVRFFDWQDEREIPESATMPEPVFEGQIVELMPLPSENIAELKPLLPEVYDNPALSSKDLFRSDVDFDGDRDLDLALLVRLNAREALGAVLEYIGDDQFRFAGKFPCKLETAADFTRCFQVMRTGGDAMHIVRWEQESGYTIMRLEEGELREKLAWRDECPPPAGASGAVEPQPARGQLRPVGRVEKDLLRLESDCTEGCRIIRFRPEEGDYVDEEPKAEWCEDPPLETQ